MSSRGAPADSRRGPLSVGQERSPFKAQPLTRSNAITFLPVQGEDTLSQNTIPPVRPTADRQAPLDTARGYRAPSTPASSRGNATSKGIARPLSNASEAGGMQSLLHAVAKDSPGKHRRSPPTFASSRSNNNTTHTVKSMSPRPPNRAPEIRPLLNAIAKNSLKTQGTTSPGVSLDALQKTMAKGSSGQHRSDRSSLSSLSLGPDPRDTSCRTPESPSPAKAGSRGELSFAAVPTRPSPPASPVAVKRSPAWSSDSSNKHRHEPHSKGLGGVRPFKIPPRCFIVYAVYVHGTTQDRLFVRGPLIQRKVRRFSI